MNKDAQIAALRTELDGYIRRGMTLRAKAVQEVLAQLGSPTATPPAGIVPSKLSGTPTTPAAEVKEPAPVVKKPRASKTTGSKKQSSK
jgi:hypothetical protein